MNKTYTIIIVLVLMALSFVAGYWLQLSGMPEGETGPEQQNAFTELTDSSLVQSWTATLYGEISSISGRDILLSFSGEELEVTVSENAQISRVSFPGPITEGEITDFEREDILFSDLAEGQNVNVVAQIAGEGIVEAISVTVIEEVASE